MSFKYYVYAYVRKSNNLPYYIGKGCNKRAIYGKHSVTVPRDKTKIVILESNLSEVGALALERRYIEWYGRKDLNTGILHNKSEGGEAGPQNIGRKHSEETKEKYVYPNTVSPVVKRLNQELAELVKSGT